MACLTFFAALHFGIDPYGTKFLNVPYIVICILDGIRFPTALFAFGVIAFHWVEVYKETIKRLNEQEMLSKINKDYHKEVTLEDIMSNIRSVHRFRLPFAIVLILFFIYRIIGMIMRGILNPAHSSMTLSFNILMVVAFVVISICYIYYGSKLYRLFPKPLDARMKGLTFNVLGLAVYCVLVLIVAAGYYAAENFNQYQLVNFLVGELIIDILLNVAGYWMIIIFEGPMIRKYFKTIVTMMSSESVANSLDKDQIITNTE